jgi:hypothetical protein
LTAAGIFHTISVNELQPISLGFVKSRLAIRTGQRVSSRFPVHSVFFIFSWHNDYN